MSVEKPAPALPKWAAELIAYYQSDAASQFILYGNINDRFFLPVAGENRLAGLNEFLLRVLLPRFDVVLSYDVGNGVRIEKGGDTFSQWPGFKESPEPPRPPRQAIEWLTRYFRYCANLGRIGQQRIQVACIVKSADLIAPASPGLNFDLSALAVLLREWSSDPALAEHAFVSFLVTENLNDLHPILAGNARAAKIKIPLPTVQETGRALTLLGARYADAISPFSSSLEPLASRLAGASLNAVEGLLKLKQYRKEKIVEGDLVRLKKELVENEGQGLIEFIDSQRSLEDLHGQERLKAWLRQDVALWRKGDLRALPMGYLLCGPVGTGKTFLVDCLAGEAGAPVVKIRNFRDKWVGSTEGNLEKIFRLLSALDRCYVFVDEADQALGKRDSGGNDSGLSGRIYSMIAAEMSRPENRGRVIWILASSRPDLIEVDLKRPGRVDVKIPIFPTTTPEESWTLLRALCARKGVELDPEDLQNSGAAIPPLMTPGAAEALAVKIYRSVAVTGKTAVDALRESLAGYQNPIPSDVIDFQIRLAVSEASDIEFVPERFRGMK